MSGSPTNEVQGAARRRVLRAVSSSPARRLQLLLLADRQSSRCRGSNRADLPAGLSPFRARPARVSREAAAPMADPYSPQSCRQSLSRSLAPPVVLDRRGIRAGEPAHHRGLGRGTRRAKPGARWRAALARRQTRGLDHALCAWYGQSRDRTCHGSLRRGHQGAHPSRDKAAGGDCRRVEHGASG